MTVKTGSKELDLMPIKMGDLDEWAQVAIVVVVVSHSKSLL